MKVTICFLLFLSLTLSLAAQDVSIRIIPETRFYNVLRLSSFDFQNPNNQPIFFTLNVRNETEENIEDLYLHYSLSMNSGYLIDPGTRVRYKQTLAPGQQLVFTNRDILTETGSALFGIPEPQYSPIDIIDRMPEFRDVVLDTGLFPDGTYTFTTQFLDSSNQMLSNEATQMIIVRNPGGIFLITPGAALGSTVQSVSAMPVNFIWSSNLAGSTYNPFTLKIKEFDDPAFLTPDYVDGDGYTVAEVEITGNTHYSDYLPLQEERYYAWQVTTSIIDAGLASPAEISSPYYVFRYSADPEYNQEATLNALRQYLLSLNIAWVNELLEAGFEPSGIINYNNTLWSGSGAENLVNELRGREVLDVRLAE